MFNSDIYDYISMYKFCPDCLGSIIVISITATSRVYRCVDCDWEGDNPHSYNNGDLF